MVQARGLGKIFSPRTTGAKVGGHDALARVLFARSTFSLLLRSGPLWPKFRIAYMKIEAFLIWAAGEISREYIYIVYLKLGAGI